MSKFKKYLWGKLLLINSLLAFKNIANVPTREIRTLNFFPQHRSSNKEFNRKIIYFCCSLPNGLLKIIEIAARLYSYNLCLFANFEILGRNCVIFLREITNLVFDAISLKHNSHKMKNQ